jgi:hypothetical protein
VQFATEVAPAAGELADGMLGEGMLAEGTVTAPAGAAAPEPQAARLMAAVPASATAMMVLFIVWISPTIDPVRISLNATMFGATCVIDFARRRF